MPTPSPALTGLPAFIERAYSNVFDQRVKERVEQVVLTLAIVSYLVHLLLIVLTNYNVLALKTSFFGDPISAIYTPFSVILVYEVYLLVFFLPKSITVYIGKQYEIITLIVIRRIFKDISNVELTTNWFEDTGDLQLTADVATSVALFILIYLFYQRIKKRAYVSITRNDAEGRAIRRFVLLKRALALLLVPVLCFLAAFTLFEWLSAALDGGESAIDAFKTINGVFFDEFFTVLIVIDVLLLLFSFFYSQQFHKIMRNSGFVISTILIKVSFLAQNFLNNILVVGAVLLGYVILLIHNLYERAGEDAMAEP